MLMKASGTTDKASEICEMSALQECSEMMREIASPYSAGDSVKAALRRVYQALPGWSFSRVRDVWYETRSVRISGDELRQVEKAARRAASEKAARNELQQINARLARIEALLAVGDEDFHRPSLDALGALRRDLDRPVD